MPSNKQGKLQTAAEALALIQKRSSAKKKTPKSKIVGKAVVNNNKPAPILPKTSTAKAAAQKAAIRAKRNGIIAANKRKAKDAKS